MTATEPSYPNLKNKPLVEAILELKWKLPQVNRDSFLDRNHRLFVGRFYDRVRSEYPAWESLPSASWPDEMVGQNVQFRFRKGEKDWPLVQVGPGILAVNETRKYRWPDFKQRALSVVKTLFDAYPSPDELMIESIMLRYIDAVDMNPETTNVFDFLREKMRVEISLPPDLFTDGIERKPQRFNWQAFFRCQIPKGAITIRFAIGQRETEPALLWETIVHTVNEEVPAMPDGFETWIDAAHAVTDRWFFALIEGDLFRRFSGD